MPPLSSLRSLLLGRAENRFGRSLALVFAATLFAATFAAYAAGVFEVAGCVVFIPGQAAIVGLTAAGVVGYSRGGLAFGWLVAYAPLLGFHADSALLELSHRSVEYRLGYFFRLDGLAYFAVEGVLIGTLAFAAGYLAGLSVEFVRDDETLVRFR